MGAVALKLTERERAGAEPASCVARDGSRASLEEDGEGEERLVVRDGASRVLFEYAPAANRCVVYAPSGDLVLSAPAGAIALDAGRGVQVRGGPSFAVEAEELRARAGAAEIDLGEVRIDGDLLRSTFRRVRQTVDVLETRTGRLVERALETYREVEGLAQLRAGRIRQVSERTHHILSARVLFKALKDLKLDGDKVHIG